MFELYSGPIRLVLFDVDGVLTDGSLNISDNGELFKTFNAKDGVAVALLHAHGIKSGVVSGKSSKALDFRINQLGFDIRITGCHDKKSACEEIIKIYSLNYHQLVFVGDDIIDLPIMQKCAVSYAPADAHPLVRDQATHTVRALGGKGVAREVAEHILKSGGMTLESSYAPLLSSWNKQNAQQ